jgi:beta-glucosidase
MRELGLGAFRFSISWPRVLPEGRGRVNEDGLDFYDRLVDELLAAGIEPFATLFHWDTPQAIEDAGGWPARETAMHFVEYAALVVARLGDRVGYWTTHNEPAVHAWLGHATGLHAPGRADVGQALAAAHHLLLSHGWTVSAVRGLAPGAKFGIALDLSPVYPATPSAEDEAAARDVDGHSNRWYLDPLFRGAYPPDVADFAAHVEPYVGDSDLDVISAPLDFLGVNNYRRVIVRAGAHGPQHVANPGAAVTDMGWEIHPEGLHRLLVRVAADYAPPSVYVTENGAAFADVRVHDGSVHDPERVAYLSSHVGAVGRALDEGVPVRGYFAWSLLDNFEWSFGYSKRFGLVYVDYPTLERVPKDSFGWYRDLIRSARRP